MEHPERGLATVSDELLRVRGLDPVIALLCATWVEKDLIFQGPRRSLAYVLELHQSLCNGNGRS